eukprot:TRINITY_DN25051_c0_g1_i1.p1 TRINITY_DN25051_c0_g1~~TRINITY_DN25051_c0_g1_i1.p1  ORF type:complete len:192 (+),score=37.55 TRINITY_DN25051_c0_g1_i1:152-727(+)
MCIRDSHIPIHIPPPSAGTTPHHTPTVAPGGNSVTTTSSSLGGSGIVNFTALDFACLAMESAGIAVFDRLIEFNEHLPISNDYCCIRRQVLRLGKDDGDFDDDITSWGEGEEDSSAASDWRTGGSDDIIESLPPVGDHDNNEAVSYTHLRAHETPEHLVCRLLLEKKKTNEKCVIIKLNLEKNNKLQKMNE